MTTPLRLPWRAGAAPLAYPVWITATRFVFTSTAAALRALPFAVRFWRGWDQVPGAIALSMRYHPRTRAACTVSVWDSEAALHDFVASPAHRHVVQTFSAHLHGTSHTWQSDHFDRIESWRDATTMLPASR